MYQRRWRVVSAFSTANSAARLNAAKSPSTIKKCACCTAPGATAVSKVASRAVGRSK